MDQEGMSWYLTLQVNNQNCLVAIILSKWTVQIDTDVARHSIQILF
jgi:hypothetical protein